jgi:hypothetical protein
MVARMRLNVKLFLLHIACLVYLSFNINLNYFFLRFSGQNFVSICYRQESYMFCPCQTSLRVRCTKLSYLKYHSFYSYTGRKAM